MTRRDQRLHKSQKLVLARAWGFKSPLPHHIFLAILAVMKKGGDDRRPVKPPCANFVSICRKNSAHSNKQTDGAVAFV